MVKIIYKQIFFYNFDNLNRPYENTTPSDVYKYETEALPCKSGDEISVVA